MAMSRLAPGLALATLVLAAAPNPAGAVDRCQTDFGDSPTAEELYNAGVCFEEIKSIGIAIRVFSELRKRHPKTIHSQKALVRLAHLYQSIAQYDRAARLFREYARRYGGEKDAAAALSDAIHLFAALGETGEAIRASESFIKMFRRRRAGDAAEVAFFIAGLHEQAGDTKAMARQLERYLKEFGNRGGRDRSAIAHARLGLMLWERSCPVRVAPGELCLKPRPTRRSNRPHRCDPSLRRPRRVARDRALVREAQDRLRRATRVFRQTNTPSARERRAGYWVTRAELALIDAELEAYVAVPFPEKLDFDPNRPRVADRSKKRFLDWVKRRSKIAETLNARYQKLLTRPDWRPLTAARMATISLDFHDALSAAEIPKTVRTGPYAADATSAYCDALDDQAKPLEERAVAAFTYCLEIGPKSDPWIKRCHAALNRLRPKEFPARLEVRIGSTHLAPVLDRAGEVY